MSNIRQFSSHHQVAPPTNDDPPAAGLFLNHKRSSRVPRTRVLELTPRVVVQLSQEHEGVVPVLPGNLEVHKPQTLALGRRGCYIEGFLVTVLGWDWSIINFLTFFLRYGSFHVKSLRKHDQFSLNFWLEKSKVLVI